MTEKEAVLILRNPLSGPSARFDAECVLEWHNWPPLAIELAKNVKIVPVEALVPEAV